jgi:hypothetical protein
MVDSSPARSTTPTLDPEATAEKSVEGDGRTVMATSQDSARLKRLEAGIGAAQEDLGTTEKDIIIVNWDGPDDPENPRKYVG